MEKVTKNYPALLTGTIDSGVFNNTGNKIKDINERLSQYKKSISLYITDSVFTSIIFAENSGYNFDSKEFEKLAQEHGKKFEYIKCTSFVKETIRSGKSYGEARLIDEAIKKSSLLKDEEIIYKLTGRIYLQNSKAICRTFRKHKNEFLVYNYKNWCFTNIFKFSKSDYLKYFKNIYEKCDEPSGNDIERVFYRTVKNAIYQGLDVGSFSAWPRFDGIQGATLNPYSRSIFERAARTTLCKLHAFVCRKK